MLLAFVGGAFVKNFDQFIEHFHLFFWLVVTLNAMALVLGYLCARLWRLSDADVRAIAVYLKSLPAGAPEPGDVVARTAQLWPHRHGTDAMFLALLRAPGA